MSLNAHFATHTLSPGTLGSAPLGSPNIVEIASSLIQGGVGGPSEVGIGTTLCIAASPNQLGDGDVSSNFRYKSDNTKNNEGCERWVDILRKAGQGVYSTTLSRGDRIRMYTMNDDGTIDVFNKEKDEVPEEKETLKKFLEHFGMDTERVKVMKGASAYGATYMADMISFIMVMETMYNSDAFKTNWVLPEIVKAGNELLKSVEKDGKVWTPISGNDYLYFKPVCDATEGAVNVMMYGDDSSNIYAKLQGLLSLEENEVKADLRKMFDFCESYTRYSDIWINDIDDALTLYMILNAYSWTDELSEAQMTIKGQLVRITETFFH